MSPGRDNSSRVIRVAAGEAGRRADVVMSRRMPEHSRSHIRKLIEHGIIRRISGKDLKPGSKLADGEQLGIGDLGALREDPGAREPEPEPIPLHVVFEDEHLLVIDKPPGLVVHPAAGAWGGTVVNALLHRFRDLPRASGKDRPGIVHRLDRNTSGLLMVAKNEYTQRGLSREFQERRVKKEYRTVVWGELNRDREVLDGSIGRNPKDRKRMAVGGVRGRTALTVIEVISRVPGFTYLRALPETGRTHQIRVHLADRGHPVVGDHVYGRTRQVRKSMRESVERAVRALPGFALHAYRLEFVHPVSRVPVRVQAPIPDSFAQLLHALKVDS